MALNWKRSLPFFGRKQGRNWKPVGGCGWIQWRAKRSPRCPELIWLAVAIGSGLALAAMFWALNLEIAKHKTKIEQDKNIIHHPMSDRTFIKFTGVIYGSLMGVVLVCLMCLPHLRIGNRNWSKAAKVPFKVLEMAEVCFIGAFFRHPLPIYCWLLVMMSFFDSAFMKIVSPAYDFVGPSIILGTVVTVAFDPQLRGFKFTGAILLASIGVCGLVVIESFEKWEKAKFTASANAAASRACHQRTSPEAPTSLFHSPRKSHRPRSSNKSRRFHRPRRYRRPEHARNRTHTRSRKHSGSPRGKRIRKQTHSRLHTHNRKRTSSPTRLTRTPEIDIV